MGKAKKKCSSCVSVNTCCRSLSHSLMYTDLPLGSNACSIPYNMEMECGIVAVDIQSFSKGVKEEGERMTWSKLWVNC